MEQITKKCKKCGEVKNLDGFHKHSKIKDGFRSECKICTLRQMAEWYKNNSEKVKQKVREYRKNNPEKVRESKQKCYKNHLEKIREKSRTYRQNNPEKIKESNRKWYENNPNNREKRRIYAKLWRENNPEKYKECRRKYISDRRKVDIHYKLKYNISSLVRGKLKRRLLNKNGKSTFSFLPYTVDDLIKHLESLFEPWMNWKNYGNKVGMWCIDHRYPDSSFNYKSVEDEEFQKCWALENLQPMEYMENTMKSNKYF